MTRLLHAPDAQTQWQVFEQLQQHRRAIRDFADRPVDPVDIDAILTLAGMAPSSMGMQPYEFHLVVTPERKALVAEACNGQRAAKTAHALVAIVIGPDISRRRVEEAVAHYREAEELPQKSRDYHLSGFAKLEKAHYRLLLPLLGWLRSLMTTFSPARSLLPLGPQGLRDWGARNAMLAAQNLMLAASARGLDSCPMEGFDGAAVSRLLGIPRSSAVAVVIALGYRAETARIEKQWRRDKSAMVITH